MASFSLKTHILPPLINPKFENVSLALHSPNFVILNSIDNTLTTNAKSYPLRPKAYPQYIRDERTDRLTLTVP